MEFFGLSLPEASSLYMGLAVQFLLRQSSLCAMPGMIILLWTLVLAWRAQGQRGGYQRLLGYLGASLVILILFWPEAVLFGRVSGRTISPTQVASYAATQDPGAEIRTAQDTQQVPEPLRAPIFLPAGFGALLKALTETPLALARAINSQTHRTFASVMPMSWLLGTELTTDIVNGVADWVHNCYIPIKTQLMQRGDGRTMEDLLPWDQSTLAAELSRREVTLGGQTAMQWLRGIRNTVRCDQYLQVVEATTLRWLGELQSPAGRPLAQVFHQELGLEPQMQVRFLVYREMLRAAGPAVPAPSLTGQYSLLRGAAVLGSVTEGLVTRDAMKATGVNGLTHEFQRAVDGVSWLVGLAVFLTWWGPYIIGVVTMVFIGLFPFVLLWALIPGSQFQPLAQYIAALLFVCAVPLWWALVDVAARLATSQAPEVGAALSPVNWVAGHLTGAAWSMMITSLGILIIPVVTGILFLGVFRAINGVWRAGL